MENTVLINPDNFEADYIRYINECFNHWGGNKEYSWAFARQVGKHTSDIMVLENEEGEVIAGSAVTYRKLLGPDGTPFDIGIMTGSWTLPNARGRGCFSKIIDLSKELAGRRNVPFLTAFVTESNASFRRLRDAGSTLLPTSFLFSPEASFANVNTAEIQLLQSSKETVADIFQQFKASQKKSLGFSYTEEEFYTQYIDRPKNPEIIKLGSEYALVEETHNVVRALLITYDTPETFAHWVKVLTNWALQERSKKLLLFSTRQQEIDTCVSLRFEPMKGYFTILPTSADLGGSPDQLMQLNITMGDKM